MNANEQKYERMIDRIFGEMQAGTLLEPVTPAPPVHTALGERLRAAQAEAANHNNCFCQAESPDLMTALPVKRTTHLGAMLRQWREDYGHSLRDAEILTGLDHLIFYRLETGKTIESHHWLKLQAWLFSPLPLPKAAFTESALAVGRLARQTRLSQMLSLYRASLGLSVHSFARALSMTEASLHLLERGHECSATEWLRVQAWLFTVIPLTNSPQPEEAIHLNRAAGAAVCAPFTVAASAPLTQWP